MSLRDTLNGARSEAAENREAAKKKDEKEVEEKPKSGSTGFEKKSLTRAKPAREAAAGVRVVTSSGKVKSGSKAPVEMTKEEKRAARQKQRDEEDRLTMAAQAMMRKDPAYIKYHKISMGMIIAGLVFTGLSWIIFLVAPRDSSDVSTVWGMLAVVTLVVAYVGVIGGFIMDWARLHKVRKAYNAKAASMSTKQLNSVIERDRRELAEKPSFFDRFRKKKTAE